MSKKNYKAAVRKLAAEKGIAYAAAKKLYDRKTGRFRNLVLQVADLADEWRSNDLAQLSDQERRQGYRSYSLTEAAQAARLEHENPFRKRILALLGQVSDVDIRKLQSVMYYGRDRDRGPITDFHPYINKPGETRDDAMRPIMEKIPQLGRYLRAGLALLDDRGEDVEGQWE